MNESLTCTSCSKVWKRERTRGRKPLLCPKCVKDQSIDVPVKSTSRKVVAKPISKPTSTPVQEVQTKTKSDLTLSQVISSLNPKRSDSAALAESTKNGSVWQCPSCKSITELFISVNDIPTHRCTPDMVSIKFMERIK